MAIRVMVSKETYEQDPAGIEVVTDYPGHPGPLYMKTSHVGQVVDIGEHNYHDDSDFFAIVFDPAVGEPREIEYASTRGWTYPNGAAVDATPEIAAAYCAYLERVAAWNRAARAAQEAATPRIGKVVKVVKGRKVTRGLTGEVFWCGADRYQGKPRIGVRTLAGDKFFTAASNVEVIQVVA